MQTKFETLTLAALTTFSLTLIGCSGEEPLVVPAQMESTSFYGEASSVEVAQRAVADVVVLISSYVDVNAAGDIDQFLIDAGEVYADSAEIFQSQEFMAPEQLGPEAFVHMLDFLYTELGEGQQGLQPKEVCNVYVYDSGEPDTIEWIMTSQSLVPGVGLVIATARMVAVRADGQWRLTYHDYADAPVAGEDCTGAQVQKVHAEWLCMAEPGAAGC